MLQHSGRPGSRSKCLEREQDQGGGKIFFFFFFFLIRNEKAYINKRTNTEENKETTEREKNQGKDERSFLHNNQGEHPTIVI